MTRVELARMIDHTLVRAYATQDDITEVCNEALQWGFATVCVNPVWVSYAKRLLGNQGVRLSVCVGFPLGANTAHIKVEETREVIQNGADEVDIVINIGAMRSGYPNFVEKELLAIKKVAGNIPLKVIIECGYLTYEQKIQAIEVAKRVGVAYVKTSTGFGSSGATVEDVRLIRQMVGDTMGVKAAGGIRTLGDVQAMIAAGASRIGTSTGTEIVQALD